MNKNKTGFVFFFWFFFITSPFTNQKMLLQEVCSSMYVKDSPVNVFMNKVDAGLVLSMCSKAIPKGVLLFNPNTERDGVLRRWLAYRHVKIEEGDVLADLAHQNMHESENNPPFMNFLDFKPERVTTDFLRAWLSWYGVGSKEPQDRDWWVALANDIRDTRANMHVVPKRVFWEELVDSQRRLEQIAATVIEAGAAIEINNAPNTQKQHENTGVPLMVLGMVGNVEAKAALAAALRVGFLVAPLLVNDNGTLISSFTMPELHLSNYGFLSPAIAASVVDYVTRSFDKGRLLGAATREFLTNAVTNHKPIGESIKPVLNMLRARAVRGIDNIFVNRMLELIISK
jgi:hypothetical protein